MLRRDLSTRSKGSKRGRGQVWCRFSLEKRETKYKSTVRGQAGSEFVWGDVHVGVWMGGASLIVARRVPLVIAFWPCVFSLAALIRRTDEGLCTRGVHE